MDQDLANDPTAGPAVGPSGWKNIVMHKKNPFGALNFKRQLWHAAVYVYGRYY